MLQKEHQRLFFCNGEAWERYIRRKLKDGEFIPQTNFADYCSLINSLPVWAFESDTQVTALSVPPGHKAVAVSDENAHLDYWCSSLKEKKGSRPAALLPVTDMHIGLFTHLHFMLFTKKPERILYFT